MVIRSFRRVFALDRRIYKIDPFSHHRSWLDMLIPPSGVPLRGMVYFGVLLVLSLIASKVPLFETGWEVLPWPVRYVIFPFWGATTGMMVHPDGRHSHLFLVTYIQWQARKLRARYTRPPVKWSGKQRVKWDEYDVALHRANVPGPATVKFRVPIVLNDRWNGWCAEGDPDGWAQTVPVRSDQTLKVKP